MEAQPREIAFVQIHRQNSDDETNHSICPGDIPAGEITSWAQVFEWWGGGRYRAVAKDALHRFIRYYPPKDWMPFEGESKQLLPFELAKRGPTSPRPVRGAVPVPAAPSVTAAAPSEIAQAVTLLAGLVQKLDEKLDARLAAPAQASDTSVIVAMMTNQTNLAIEQAKANAAAAAEQVKANATMMQSVFQVLNRDPPPPPPPPPQTNLESLVMLMKTFLPPPAAPQGLGEQVTLLKGLSEVLTPSAATAAPDPFSKVVDFLGQAMALDSQKKLTAEPAAPAPPPRNEPPRERFYLPGTGIVQILVPDGEVRAAAPPLAAAPAPAPAAAPAPTLVAAPAPAPAFAAAPASALTTPPAPAIVVPIAPPPAPREVAPAASAMAAVAEATPAAALAPTLPAPAVVVPTAPPPAPREVAPAASAVAAVAEATPAAALAPPPTPAAAPPAPEVQPVASAPAADQGPPQAPPAPIVEVAAPPRSVIVEVTDADRREVLRRLRVVQRLPLAERKSRLRLVPTFEGPQGEQLADLLDQIPSEILPAFVDKMDSDHIGLLRHCNGLDTGA